MMSRHPFGNYVIQHAFEHGSSSVRRRNSSDALPLYASLQIDRQTDGQMEDGIVWLRLCMCSAC